MSNDITLERSFIFYVATLLFFGVGGITTLGLEWYASLVTPSWAPPELLVACIWGVLFFATALSASTFWETCQKKESHSKLTIMLYMGNAMLILLWNYVFFGLHMLQAAFWIAVAVGVSVLILMFRLWDRSRASALYLIPYLAWMLFAMCLTYSILLLNP